MKTILAILAFTVPILANPAQLHLAAGSIIKTLDEKQKPLTVFPFENEERENWHYFPKNDRKGIRVDQLSAFQIGLLRNLLKASLGQQGELTARQIIQLEAYLFEKSGQDDFRHPGKYHLAIFGTPSPDEVWGFRYEGHHLSLNFTIDKEQATLTTPFFFGASPAEVPDGELKGLRPLGLIEDNARKLALQLHRQNLEVRFTEEAPREVITGADRVAKPLEKVGVAYSGLAPTVKTQFLHLIQAIAANQKHLLASLTREKIESAHFGWAGSFDEGKPHYFRIQTDDFLVEYANTQNNANHAHLVWRDFKNDFGRDLLKEHMEHEH